MMNEKTKLIRGAGGGGKGGGGASHVPSESADSLQSKAFAKLIDLVSEGEIDGLVNGMKSIYLDGTPLQGADDKFNFKGVVVQARTGTQNQDYIPGFSTVENEIQVGVEVKETPIVRTITDESIDAIRVHISMPQMTYQNPSTGDLGGTEVNYAIDLQSNGGGWQEVVNDTVIGKSVSKYERAYRVELSGPGPWDIRVRRVTSVPTSVTTQNRTIWETYTEIVDGKLRYPNSALIATEIDSSQFSSIPTRGYDIRGLKIRVPSNSTTNSDGSLSYSGIWDGTFRISWTSNPAWIFYDLLTASRYGLADFIPESHVDKWSLYTIGKYCDEKVSDGRGGLEPRFSCNMYLQTREEAFKVLQDLASSFRGMVYWAGGIITVTQDSPQDPAHLFTAANVVDGSFIYSGSSAKSRHTVAQVSWNDPEDLYRQKIEYVEDSEGISKFGVIETEVIAFGCTSRSQANRLGRWILYSEKFQTETVQFKTGLEGSVCKPGQIIKIADPMRAGARRSGRIVSATASEVTADQEFTIGSGFSLSVQLADKSIQERSLLSSSGNKLYPTTPFSSAPMSQAIFMVSDSNIEPQFFKVIGVTEEKDGIYSVVALAHDPQKFDFIEQGLKLEPRLISSLSAIPDAPTNVQLTETLYAVNADVRVKVTVSWNAVQGASSYVVQYSRDNGNIITLPPTQSNDIEILSAEPGTYYVSVYALSPLGAKSAVTTAEKRIIGKTLPPSDVTGFSLIPSNSQALLSWDKATDLDVLIGGSVRIRHTPNIVDPVWRNSVDIALLSGTATRAQVPLIPGTYLIKFVDSSDIASNTAAMIVTTVPAPLALNVVSTITESPSFTGSKTKMEYMSAYGGLVLGAERTIDEVLENIDDVPLFDFAGGVATYGTYDFANVVDLTQVYSSRVTASIDAEARDVTDSIDQRLDLIDDWADLDGDFIDDVNAELWVKTTLDDPNNVAAVWTAWKRFVQGEYNARGFKFQLRATSGNINHNIIIKALSVSIDMPDRVVNLSGLSSGTGAAYTVTYPEAFAAVPAIGITAKNMQTGDYYTITSESNSGFQITFKNSAGSIVSRTFDVLAKGYGRKLN